jgi:hypothetical protein
MTKPLLALCLLALCFPLGCGVDEETPPDPLATREGFCDSWGQNACQQNVVDNCNAPSVEDCVDTQTHFCLDIVPEKYSMAHARECLNAVKAAYSDAVLSADDIKLVIKLGPPCDQLSTGTSDERESCTENEDCNTAGGFVCVMKADDVLGSCEKPELVGGGKACDDPQQVCEADFYCNGKNCVAYTETGEVCAGDFECQPAEHCVVAVDATEGTCEPRLARSSVCATDNDCQSLYCAKADDETEGRCADKIVLSLNEPLCNNLR